MYSEPSQKLIGKDVNVIVKKYAGVPYSEQGIVRGYDPSSMKWWVINVNWPHDGFESAWFAENELEVA